MGHQITEAELDQNRWAACGPAALAAALGLSLAEIRHVFPEHTPDRVWTNLLQMWAALNGLRVPYTSTRNDETALVPAGAYQAHPIRRWPHRGLVQMYFRGSWEARGVPPGAGLSRSHWIAVRAINGHPFGASWMVFDVNAVDDAKGCDGWIPRPMWEADVVPALAAVHKKATGLWWTRAGIELAETAPR